ncbi:MAG: triose-phosphate isomerase [Sulfitobacter sp.]
MRRKLAAGNWKMNGTAASLAELSALGDLDIPDGTDVLVCPPATLISRACEVASGGTIAIGAQDCHTTRSGAHTGDISAEMIADTGATYVILGHSERRADHAETSSIVQGKVQAAWQAGLTAIICIGETLEDRDAGNTLQILAEQLAGSVPDGITPANTVIAYEPVWAIGTGHVPEMTQIIEAHDFIRATLSARFGATTADLIPLLYGGSVKADNAAAIFKSENVDGALVGGASLKASDFAPIIKALAES